MGGTSVSTLDIIFVERERVKGFGWGHRLARVKHNLALVLVGGGGLMYVLLLPEVHCSGRLERDVHINIGEIVCSAVVDGTILLL